MKFIGPLLILLLAFSCSKIPPEKTLRKVQGLMRSESHKEACEKLQTIDTKKIGKWAGDTIYNYLRLRALCVHHSGQKGGTIALASPYREYYGAMLSVGAGKSLEKATGFLKKALASRPNHAELYYRLGLFYLLDERFDLACPLIHKAVELGRTSTDGYRLSLARCLLGNGKIAQIPQILAPLVYDGVVLKDLTHARQIMENARLFKRLMPPQIRSTILVVKSFLRKGNGGKALDMLLEQVQANPQYPLLHYLLAVVHLRLGNKADSVSQLRQCLKLDPTDPDAWYLLARLYLNSTHANLAEGFLKKSLRYDPLSSKARTLLRNYYIKTEAFSLAADYHQTVIWLSGEKRSVNQAKTLGELLEKANRNDEALKTWKKVLKKLGPDAGIDAVKALARIHLTLSLTGSEKTVYHRKEAARLVKLGLKLRPMDSELVAMGKQVGVKHEVAKSPFESKIRVKGAKHVNKDDDMLFN